MRSHRAFARTRSVCRYLAESWRTGLTIFAFTRTGAMRRLRVAPPAVLAVLLLLAAAALLSGGLIHHAARYTMNLARTVRLERETIRLERENGELISRLAAQAEQLSRLVQEVGRLRELEAMIRTISGMESAGEQPLIGTGYGGLEGRALREQLLE